MRTLLFDGHGVHQPGVGAQIAYRIETTADGGVEVDPTELARLAIECLTAIHGQMSERGLRPAAVAFCTFWHCFLGVSGEGQPTTSIIHLFDTRSREQVRRLAELVDARASHARTGCVLHTSYWPAKLLWLAQHQSASVAATRWWMSFGEYLFLRLFGRPATTTSMASASGIWNQNANDYDDTMLALLPVDRGQLAPPDAMDEPVRDLLPEFRSQWPLLADVPWFPSLGDGACNNLGSGCVAPDTFSLMVGTSGAMRAVVEAPRLEVPAGLWCYRADRRRLVLGGALSNGGEVFAWMQRTLALPSPEEVERALAAMVPGDHGLTLLPLFAGERSTGWRPDARAAITGLGLHTRPIDILRAALEAVALRFRLIYEILAERLGEPRQVIASGGGLLHSPAWTQMMADALGRPVVTCTEPEATGRGAAMFVLERLGAIASLSDLPPQTGAVFQPNPAHGQAYAELFARQRRLYRKLFEED